MTKPLRREVLRRIVAILGILSILSGVLGLTAATASANGQVEKNPDCQDLGYDNGFKIDGADVKSGTFDVTGVAGATVTLSNVTQKSANEYIGFDWSSSGIAFDAVLVKASTKTNTYAYNGATSGTGLVSPLNTTNGQRYGISHISFCWNDDDSNSETTQPGVTWIEPSCRNENQAGYTPTNSDFTYAVTDGALEPGAEVEVTATLKDGVEKEATGPQVFTHTFGAADEDCDDTPVTPIEPTIQHVCGADDSVTLTPVTGVRYLVDGNPVTGPIVLTGTSSVTITAEALEGYQLAEGTWTWTKTATAQACGGGGGGGGETPTTSTTQPVLGLFSEPEVLPEVSPELIVAPTPTQELALTPEVEAAAPAPTPEPQLAFTGSDSRTLTMLALALLGLGSLLILGSRKRSDVQV